MKKIERRAVLCLILAGALLVGLALFCVRYVRYGGRWAAFAANRHLYNSAGELSVGRVLDRDGDALSWVDENGARTYYANADVRRATLHAVGDAGGKIGAGALTAFGDRLSGYNLLTGAYSPLGQGNDVYLTLDARYNYIAYQALNGRRGAVGVYNYKTGELLCMVSTPTFDPLNEPVIEEGDPRYDGVYVNRFLSGLFVPGSVYKTVTAAAALEQLPDVLERTWTCTGATQVGDGTVTCPHAHGTLDLYGAMACSCNGVFALLTAELGSGMMETYTEKAGLTARYSVSGLGTAAGQFDFDGGDHALGWAGVGQGKDLMNPCALMIYMGAIANGGQTAVPKLLLKTENALGLSVSSPRAKQTGTLIEADTARLLGELMAYSVQESYGTSRFPNMDLCAKSGTGEVGDGKAPNAWFAGFLRGEDTPYAFVVVVENGGSGADAAGGVAARVLDAVVNGY